MEDFLNDVIKERSDCAELSTKALRAAILEELAYAKHVREHMPNGVCLKRHFKAQEDTLHGLISKVNHICRVVKDADVSVKFYQKIMGARLLNRPRFATNGFWLWLGNVQLHLIQSSLTVVPDHSDAPAGRVNHMSFDVFNIQDCEERLTEAGVKFSKVITCPMTPRHCTLRNVHSPPA
jgi:glyoxylase I family protein